MTQMIVIGAFTTWYWTYNKSKVPFFTLASSAVRAFRYHIGTIALGSPIILICSGICSLLGIGIARSGCGLCMCFRCCCCLGRFKEFLRRFNRNAYIMCSMHGNEFCTSAVDAYHLIFRNWSAYNSTDFVLGLVFFVSQILLACATGAFVYFHYSVHSIMPILCLIFGAFYVFQQFFAVCSIAVDTLLLCARELKWLLSFFCILS